MHEFAKVDARYLRVLAEHLEEPLYRESGQVQMGNRIADFVAERLHKIADRLDPEEAQDDSGV